MTVLAVSSLTLAILIPWGGIMSRADRKTVRCRSCCLEVSLLPGGEEYRSEHGLDKPKKVGPAWGGRVAGGHPRQPKPWFWSKYYASRMVLNELEQEYFGQQYKGMFTTALDEVFKRTRVIL